VTDYEKMLDGLYARLEAKETECRELREEQTASREQIGRLTTTLDSLRREHDSLVSSADTLTDQLLKQKREQVCDTIQLYLAQLPSTVHKYRYIELQNKIDALFVQS
jgi:chromosome segregation ATPase